MKSTSLHLLSLLSLFAGAKAQTEYWAVTLTAFVPGLPIHGLPLAASGFHFWIGKPTSTYCPSVVQNCPKGNDTSIGVSNESTTAGMNVVVPGGQQIYVAPDGALSYTQPHSAYIPPGSTVTGFGLVPFPPHGLEFVTPSHRIFACPEGSGSSVYQIFDSAKLPTNHRDCVDFRVLATPATDHVWEYT